MTPDASLPPADDRPPLTEEGRVEGKAPGRQIPGRSGRHPKGDPDWRQV